MDTDSIYIAISNQSIHDIVKTDLKLQFYEEYDKWFVSESCKKHREDFKMAKINGTHFEPKACCISYKKYDTRTPGKFHVEAEADGMICLNSKTYICYNKDQNKIENVKSASKGLSKKLNKFNTEDYLNVIKTKTPKYGVNKGFSIKFNKLLTYEQSRAGLGYLYIKRRVCSDGITTKPIKI